MSFYAIGSVVASAGGDDVAVIGQAAVTRMVAIPLSELVCPVRAGSGEDGRSALVVEGGAPIRSGVAVAWCKIVAVAPAVVRRDGRVQADGRPCDHARLGAAEQELDRRCGPGTIERIAAGVRPTGKIKAVSRREMSVAFTIRATRNITHAEPGAPGQTAGPPPCPQPPSPSVHQLEDRHEAGATQRTTSSPWHWSHRGSQGADRYASATSNVGS